MSRERSPHAPSRHVMIAHAKFVACSLVGLALSACGSSGGSDASTAPSCPAPASCGGDLIGAWQLDSECLTLDSPFDQPECTSSIQGVAVQVQGSVTYAAGDGDAGTNTQTSAFTYAFTASERYSSACLKALRFDGATADACHGLELLWAGAVSVSCTPDGDACLCQFADQESAGDSEPFSAENGQILVPGADPVAYCVNGDALVESASTSSSHVVLRMHRMP